MSEDLLKKCRTCLSDSHIFHQLFDYVDENYKILEMLDGIVPQIDIKATTKFSSNVCQSCVDKLLIGYKFQQLCIETNSRLFDLMGIVEFETAPKLEEENILDPLTGEASFKMKQEIEDEACFECEINPEEIEVALGSASDNDWGNDTEDNDTDSSNEKLSVLKERKSKKSPTKPELQKPYKNSLRKGPFPCSECDKVFDRVFSLKRHVSVHSKLRAYRCDICKYSSSAEKPYNAHMHAHETGKIKTTKFTCSECGKVFNRLFSLNRHVSLHSNVLPYRCGICKYSFAAEKSYNDHMLTHDNGEDLETKIENKNKSNETNDFNNGNTDLKDENDIGKEIQLFQCPDCPKCFEKKSSLSAHYKVHTKKTKKKTNKDPNNEEFIDEVAKSAEEINEKTVDAYIEEVPKVIVKEEIEVTPQIFEEPMDDLNADAEWFDNDYEDSDDTSEKNIFAKPGAKHTKNLDFIDTGIGEIEKPNSSNKRSGSFPCEICGKVFDRPYRLKRHSSVHSITRPHECEICKYRFATVNILKAHLIQHEGEGSGILVSQSRPEGFKCPDCPRRFEKQASLSAHRQIHTRNAAETNYPCMVCNRNFMSVRSLTEHITNKHPEVEKHKCDQCEKTFVLHAHLVEHLNRHKGNKNLVCLICEKEFGYTNTLKEHMRTHSGESPYLCPQCGKTFRSASNLRQHMERHTGLKKYQCPECPSRFNCRSDLIKHASTHTNAKPHVCDICGSRFTRAYSLQKHKLLHSGERPFKCDQCSMTFAIIYHLRRHMRTHTGEKPYKCKYCDRAYAESGDLTKHLRTHVGENTYMCDQCPVAFKYQAELRQHVSEHYKMSQKLMQQAQKMSEDAQQHEIAEQTQHHQQQQQLPVQDHNHHLIAEQTQHLTIGIASHHQMQLVNHNQQLPTIVEQAQQHSQIDETTRRDNLDLKNLTS